jgi:hypothetical protein
MSLDRNPVNSLRDIVRIWDLLSESRNLVFPTALRGGWIVTYSGRILKIKTALAKGTSPPMLGLSTRQALLQDIAADLPKDTSDYSVKKVYELLSDDKDVQCYFMNESSGLFIVVRAECVSERVSPEASLTMGLPPPLPPLGDFSQSFPDVADLAKHLQTLSLDDLQTFFRTEMNRSGETIELPGVKLPGEAVTSWGIVILMMIEGYFFVVFREFSYRVRPDDTAWNVPWIGVSSDNISSGAFVASIFIVLVAVSYLTWNGVKSTSSIWMMVLYGMGFMGSVAFVVAIFLRRRASLSVTEQAAAAEAHSWLC